MVLLHGFVKKTQKIRDHARKLGIKLCHEIHPGTAAAKIHLAPPFYWQGGWRSACDP